MKTIILPGSAPDAIPQAMRILENGGLVAFPTDTVYGLGASPTQEKAIKSLYAVKVRQPGKAVPLLVGNLQGLDQVAGEVNKMAARLAAHFWPGALTLVVPRHPGLPALLAPDPTIGVRMPAHPLALALLTAAGPLAVTSANLSGAPSAVTAAQVEAQLGGSIPLILDGGQAPGGVASTVVDCTGAEPVILRQGPISLEQIRAALGGAQRP